MTDWEKYEKSMLRKAGLMIAAGIALQLAVWAVIIVLIALLVKWLIT